MLRNNNASIRNPETFHKVRIAFKKFRYEAEHLSSILNFDDNYFIDLKILQTILGKIQDEIVFGNMMNMYIGLKKMKLPAKIKSEHNRNLKSLIEEYLSNPDFIRDLKPVMN